MARPWDDALHSEPMPFVVGPCVAGRLPGVRVEPNQFERDRIKNVNL